ncbi:unnamed protein product [Mycena citricolor]|uniref:Mitochondrial Rho GTPase 1 n=1 Tax=Mycena citricolor TaxID=2018698 RepID=A0AAD2JZQ9_9AGAR|nr:unnamed protein product [Mycena citricolor]
MLKISIVSLVVSFGFICSAYSKTVVDLGYAKYEPAFDSTSNLTTFLGIRYAAPQSFDRITGDLRWNAPVAPAKANGTQKAINAPPQCYQGPFAGQASTSLSARTNDYAGQSEDCLFLSVYTPDLRPQRLLPTIVWIHGGGYSWGNESTYNGADLVNESGSKFVVVTIQYRLGLFGFLAGEQVKKSGVLNAGLLDQQFALHWVQDHIHKFGGDPAHVVIWGQSAGAGSVIQHVVANGGKTEPKLFKTGITSSLFLPPQYGYGDVIPQSLFDSVAGQAGCASGDQLDCLRRTDGEVLQGINIDLASAAFEGTFTFLPVVDGSLITKSPADALEQGETNGDELLVITNSLEAAVFVDQTVGYNITQFTRNMLPLLDETQAESVAAIYHSVGSTTEQATAIMTEGPSSSAHPISLSMLSPATLGRSGEYAVPPAVHGEDIFYYFQSISFAGFALAYNNTDFITAFQQVFFSFAANGDPSLKLQPSIAPYWPRWSDGGNQMVFNRTAQAVPQLTTAAPPADLMRRCALWKELRSALEYHLRSTETESRSMRRDVRVLLVGDEGVGKSTLVTTLIKESYVAHVQHIVPEVTIPPEVTPENVTTYIVDSGAGPQDRPHLESEIRKAHVICVVYSIDNANSFDRIPTFWLPHFRQLGVNVPVILVGNKIDLRGDDPANETLAEEILPIMNEFKEVETCIECSAKQPVNVSEVFYFAQKAVLHPTAPLYDSRDHVLKPACVSALQRIFKLCDLNKDGILDAAELNDFQRKCFDAPLQVQELEGIRQMVSAHTEGGVKDGGLTERGFLYLHTTFIQRGRLETTWTVLRKFGYAEDLKLTEGFLLPKFDVLPDCSVELSPLGYQFFTDLFETFDKDQDGALKTHELDEVFSTSPGNPWATQKFPDTTLSDDSGAVTLQGWLAQWSMTTLLDHKTTLAYLAYLGYPNEPRTGALQVTRPRKTDRRKGKVTRNVFLCYLCGAAGSGKTSLLRAFAGKPISSVYEPTTKVVSVVNSVAIDGSEKYLVLQEFGSKYEAEMLRNSKKLDLADVIVHVYDSGDTNSFSYISNLRASRHRLDNIPTLFVATKSDLDLAQQRHEVQPDVYCRRLGLQVPVAVSVRTGQTADVFHEICAIALNPHGAIPGGLDRARSATARLRMYMALTALFGGCTAGLFMLYRTLRPGRGAFPGLDIHSWIAWIVSGGKRDL